MGKSYRYTYLLLVQLCCPLSRGVAIVLLFNFSLAGNTTLAQPAPVPIVKDTKAANRLQLYKNLNKSISRNLSLPLSDSTEEYWMDAFNAMELIRFQSPWAESQVRAAFTGIDKRSAAFQRSLLELVYALYPAKFSREVSLLMPVASGDKVFAMCAEYLHLSADESIQKTVLEILRKKTLADPGNPVFNQLNQRLKPAAASKLPPLELLLYHPFFDTATVVFSFQRANRNYPGLVMVRDRRHQFVKDETGNYFNVAQLARSINNLPGYLTNGNTPQGIFRLFGQDKSRSIFIGPTPNLQLTMPFETSVWHFMNDSTISDSTWSLQVYKKLLPEAWAQYPPVMEAYYAGQAGRSEIIAHGTTVSPDYYSGQPYYPLTPTLGCLCTRELWSGEDGRRMVSDQQLLVNAVEKAGGANGYLIVIELDSLQRPVLIDDLLPFLKP